MDQVFNLLKGFGAPNWVLLALLVAYAIGKEFHVLRFFGPGNKSERESISEDNVALRKDMMEWVEASKRDRKDLREQLQECEENHAKTRSEITDLNERVDNLRTNLDTCEEKHEVAIHQINVISAGYRFIQKQLGDIREVLKDGGYEALFAKVGIADMPENLEDLLAGIERPEPKRKRTK